MCGNKEVVWEGQEGFTERPWFEQKVKQMNIYFR